MGLVAGAAGAGAMAACCAGTDGAKSGAGTGPSTTAPCTESRHSDEPAPYARGIWVQQGWCDRSMRSHKFAKT